ncbi:MAG: OmpA family protein [Bacteroidales bacterium]|nr:OmpA family protein [Bacteroidales bacterium]
MKLYNIIAVAALSALVVVGATSCQSKKKKAAEEAAAKAAAEEAARQKAAEEEAARLAARTFELTEEVTLSASETVAEGAEAYREALAQAKKATAYGATSFAVPTASLLYANEQCALSQDAKETLKEFLDVWNASDKKSVILIEAYAKDTDKAAPKGGDKAEYNAALAVERANLVKGWLFANQVPAKNVKVACNPRKVDGDQKRVNVSIQ